MNKQHPQDVGLTYIQHLKFTWGESVRLVCMSGVMLFHGIVPWIWDWRCSYTLAESLLQAKRPQFVCVCFAERRVLCYNITCPKRFVECKHSPNGSCRVKKIVAQKIRVKYLQKLGGGFD